LGHGIWQLGEWTEISDDAMRDRLFHDVYGAIKGGGTPYGALWQHGGDRMWVRETWQAEPGPLRPGTAIVYREDYRDDSHGYDGEKSPEGKYRTWRPSIFMPRWASRITLEITDVRVQRLQEISEDDAQAEGVCCRSDLAWGHGGVGDQMAEWAVNHGHRFAFRELWDSINGKTFPWDSNPWVWAITFKRIEV
jgi:hypothetical protein